MEFDRFHPWTLPHKVALACIALVCVSVILAFWNGRGRKWRTPVTAGVALLSGATFLANQFKQAIDHGGDPQHWLPLHLCHVTLAMAIFAAWRKRTVPYEFAYFFGIGGTAQALLTPNLQEAFPQFEYFTFFICHGGILVLVALMTVAFQMRPRPGAVMRMIIAGNAYMAVAAVANALTGANFGYLAHKPENKSLLDMLGPWPTYILWMELIGVALLLLLYAPWYLMDRTNTRDEAPEADLA
ncbi:MAG: TIGR02206 family membrane protein [Candidatus Sumerlaeaceae bacterium]|nr:TIGR02206 family membrane protein [Candidatus Sumerlaeaceae bacterium]